MSKHNPARNPTRNQDAKRNAFHDDVSRCIRGHRIAAGLSQRELADLMGLPQGRVSQLESGTAICSLYHASLIAEALDITIDDLAPVTIDEKEAAE